MRNLFENHAASDKNKIKYQELFDGCNELFRYSRKRPAFVHSLYRKMFLQGLTPTENQVNALYKWVCGPALERTKQEAQYYRRREAEGKIDKVKIKLLMSVIPRQQIGRQIFLISLLESITHYGSLSARQRGSIEHLMDRYQNALNTALLHRL